MTLRTLGAGLLGLLLAVPAVVTMTACSSPTQPNNPGRVDKTDVRVGTGAEATSGKQLTVNYTGWLYDANRADHKGTQFDTSVGRTPYSFVLGAGIVIPGWEQGLVGMKVGGLRTLVVSPELAYGSVGYPGVIPPNATLLFEVELLDVK